MDFHDYLFPVLTTCHKPTNPPTKEESKGSRPEHSQFLYMHIRTVYTC